MGTESNPGRLPERLCVVSGDSPVQRSAAIFSPEVDDGAAVDQRYQHPGRLQLQPRGQSQGRFWKKEHPSEIRTYCSSQEVGKLTYLEASQRRTS